MKKSSKSRNSTTGQVMITTILALGGVLMGATAIAGLLMVYQIRQASDLANSTKAIFAADTGVEWGLYQYGPCSSDPVKCDPDSGGYGYDRNGPTLTNRASIEVSCYNESENKVDCTTGPAEVRSIRSQGSSGKSSRAFLIEF